MLSEVLDHSAASNSRPPRSPAVTFQVIQHHTPEVSSPHGHCSENPKYHRNKNSDHSKGSAELWSWGQGILVKGYWKSGIITNEASMTFAWYCKTRCNSTYIGKKWNVSSIISESKDCQKPSLQHRYRMKVIIECQEGTGIQTSEVKKSRLTEEVWSE
jgi:hypothetical protein